MNPSCGDTIEVRIVIKDGVIREISFDGKGCAISQAAMSMLTERIKGMTVPATLKLSREDMLVLLGIPIGIVRMKCALLGLRTTQEAIRKATIVDASKDTA
jgi:nitrogen fixation protein NifU and related proteins